MEAFVPLHKSALERSPVLRPWLEDVLAGHGAHFLSPEGWFEGADKKGTVVWAPAPAAADLVVERLAQARHKRSQLVTPRGGPPVDDQSVEEAVAQGNRFQLQASPPLPLEPGGTV